MEWYYAEDRQQKGPVSEEKFAELVRNGIVRGETLVWKAGMSNWQPYSQVIGAAAPPPPPPFTPAPSVPGETPTQPQSQTQGPSPASYHPQMPVSSAPASSYPTPAPAPAPATQPASFTSFNDAANNGQRDRALTLVKPPAISLMILAAICLFQGIRFLFSASQIEVYDQFAAQGVDAEMIGLMKRIHPVTSPVSGIGTLICAVIMFFGGYRMMNLKSYGLAIAAAIVAMLPCSCPCCCLGIIFGVWALVVLNKPEVKSQFG